VSHQQADVVGYCNSARLDGTFTLAASIGKKQGFFIRLPLHRGKGLVVGSTGLEHHI
jgi:hypothetical protein